MILLHYCICNICVSPRIRLYKMLNISYIYNKVIDAAGLLNAKIRYRFSHAHSVISVLARFLLHN